MAGSFPRSFIDTNVLVYLAAADPVRADAAEKIVAAGGTVSVQVLNELANVGRRKMRMPWPELHRFLAAIRGLLSVVPLTAAIHDAGLALAEQHGLSTYDAMIVAAAMDCDCDTLWSEDMHHGMVFGGGLRIINPFALPPPGAAV